MLVNLLFACGVVFAEASRRALELGVATDGDFSVHNQFSFNDEVLVDVDFHGGIFKDDVVGILHWFTVISVLWNS